VRHTLLGYSLAGALGGALAALVDAGAAQAHAAVALPGAMGLHSLIGLSLGLLLGMLRATLPEAHRPRTLLRRLARALVPQPEDALHRRTRAVATLWTGALLLRFLLPMGAWAYAAVLQRVNSPVFTGLVTALVGVVVALIGLAFAAPVRAVLTRALEFAARRWPRVFSPITLPVPHLIWATIWLAASAQRWGTHASGEDVEWVVRSSSAVLLGAAVLLGGGEVARHYAPRLRPALAGLLVVAVALLALAGLATGLGDDVGRSALAEHAPLSGLVARLLTGP
jgi:hypothetical protein